MKTVVVGCGYTGRRVCSMLPAEDTVALGRSSRIVAFDLDSQSATIPALPADYALLYTVPPAGDTPADRRLGTLLRILAPHPRRFVYISTSGVYGDCDGATVDESAPTAPGTDRAKRRLAAEMLLQEWCDNHVIPLVILRVPGIYGPGRLMLDRICEGEPVLIEADARPGNRIHVTDLARCCVVSLTTDVPAGIYNVGDGDHRSSSWFAQTVAAMAGLPSPPEITWGEARKQMSSGWLSFLSESRRLDTTKMREVLGVTPQFADAEDGIRASLTEDNLLAETIR